LLEDCMHMPYLNRLHLCYTYWYIAVWNTWFCINTQY